jgi:polyhydroxyalkanoate synthesis regulator phasin
MGVITKKWAVIVGTAAIATSIAAGSAFAASAPKAVAPNAADPTQQADNGAHKHDKTPLSPAQEAVMTQIKALAKKHMEQLKTESTALIDQAVKDGKLTQAQADEMKSRSMGSMGDHGKGGSWMKAPMTKEQRDAKLDAAVKSGKMTQEQADKLKAAPMPAPGQNMGKQRFNVTPEQFKQNIADAVKAGKLTQAKADEMLKQFAERTSATTN